MRSEFQSTFKIILDINLIILVRIVSLGLSLSILISISRTIFYVSNYSVYYIFGKTEVTIDSITTYYLEVCMIVFVLLHR